MSIHTSKLYTENRKSTYIKKAKSATETCQSWTKGMWPFSQWISILVLVLSSIFISIDISLPFTYSKKKGIFYILV